MLARAIKDARQGYRYSIRELARRAEVSPAQVSRIEAGEVGKPSTETLIALSRGLDRNPLPLLIVAGHIEGDEARSLLRQFFRDGSELVDAWSYGSRTSIEEARRLVKDESATNSQLSRLAAEVFATPETDETLWDDSYVLALAEGQGTKQLRELLTIWRSISRVRREQILEYARVQQRASDLEFKAWAETQTAAESDQVNQ